MSPPQASTAIGIGQTAPDPQVKSSRILIVSPFGQLTKFGTLLLMMNTSSSYEFE